MPDLMENQIAESGSLETRVMLSSSIVHVSWKIIIRDQRKLLLVVDNGIERRV